MAITKGKSKIDRRNVETTGGAAVRAAQIDAAVKGNVGEAGLAEGKKAKTAITKTTTP